MEWKNLNSKFIKILSVFIVLFLICACNNKEQNKPITTVTETETEKANETTKPKNSIEVMGSIVMDQSTNNFMKICNQERK